MRAATALPTVPTRLLEQLSLVARSRTINLGILAHVDAGKTSLTERLLFEAGAIAELGSVDAGTTRTDSMDIERRRGITVRTNVASFAAGGVQVNLIDTPGHSDFIAEVERSLAVLDAAVLVVSAVEGVQPQTVVLWRVLRRLAVPAADLHQQDRPPGGRTPPGCGPGSAAAWRRVGVRAAAPDGRAGSRVARARPPAGPADGPSAIDVLTSADDRLLPPPWTGRGVTEAMALRSARAQVGRGAVVPVAAGSALTGAGVPDLLTALPRLMPWARPVAARCPESSTRSSTVITARWRTAACSAANCASGTGPPRRGQARGDHVPGAVDAGGLGRGRASRGPATLCGYAGSRPAHRRLGGRGHPRPGYPPVPGAPRLNPWSSRSTRPAAAGCSRRCGNWPRPTR